ncbi:MAG: hypothetical protein RL754_1120 [Bacteroidota bacterium]
MKKLLLLSAVGLGMASCGTCDCEVHQDLYTWNAFEYELTATNTIGTDTCLTAGVIDSTETGGGAYLTVTRVVCP